LTPYLADALTLNGLKPIYGNILVLLRNCALQIDRGEKNENVGLQERYSDVQAEKNNRNTDRDQ
jgi:hypothetical protein